MDKNLKNALIIIALCSLLQGCTIRDLWNGLLDFNFLYLFAFIVGIVILFSIFIFIGTIWDNIWNKLYEIFPSLKSFIGKLLSWIEKIWNGILIFIGWSWIVLVLLGILMGLYALFVGLQLKKFNCHTSTYRLGVVTHLPT